MAMSDERANRLAPHLHRIARDVEGFGKTLDSPWADLGDDERNQVKEFVRRVDEAFKQGLDAVPAPEPQSPEPSITSLSPSSAIVGGSDLILTVTGKDFNEQSVIVFNGGDEQTDFISNTKVSTGVKSSLVGAPITVPVAVRNGVLTSNAMNFTFFPAETPERTTRRK